MKVLKIDLDYKPDKMWRAIWKYTRCIILAELKHYVKEIFEHETARGYHYYIHLYKDVSPETANALQFLCGDDHTRVKINQWRIERGVKHWNKMFHRVLWRRKRK